MYKRKEDYLVAIYALRRQSDIVRSIDVAQYMNYSKPSVSRAVSTLRSEGYLVMMENGDLVFTDEGERLACKIHERHSVLARLLQSGGLGEEAARQQAGELEQVLSEEAFLFFKRLQEERHLAAQQAGKAAERPTGGAANAAGGTIKQPTGSEQEGPNKKDKGKGKDKDRDKKKKKKKK